MFYLVVASPYSKYPGVFGTPSLEEAQDVLTDWYEAGVEPEVHAFADFTAAHDFLDARYGEVA